MARVGWGKGSGGTGTLNYCSGVGLPHGTDIRPLLFRHGLHRQAGAFYQWHICEPFVGLDINQGNGHRKWSDRFDVDTFPSGIIGRTVLMCRSTNFNDANDRSFTLRMIKETTVTNGHVPHEITRLVIAHAVPFLAGVTLVDLVFPAPGRWLGFEQPIGHQPITLFQIIS